MHSSNSLKYWRLAGAVVVLEPSEKIQRRVFPPINFLSKSEWNRWSKRHTSDLNCSSAEVIDVDDRDKIL